MSLCVFTLLKNTELYLDEYFVLNLVYALINAEFNPPQITSVSSRY